MTHRTFAVTKTFRLELQVEDEVEEDEVEEEDMVDLMFTVSILHF